MYVLPRALDDSPTLQVRSVEGTRLQMTRMAVCPAVPFQEAEAKAAVGEKRPRGSRERAPVNVQCKPKDNDEIAHQQLPSNFEISLEGRLAQPNSELPSRDTKSNRNLRRKLLPNCDRLSARAKEDLRCF